MAVGEYRGPYPWVSAEDFPKNVERGEIVLAGQRIREIGICAGFCGPEANPIGLWQDLIILA